MNFRQVASAVAGALALAGVMAADANAQRRDRFDPEWVLLGEKSVGFRVDRDVINISQREAGVMSRAFSSGATTSRLPAKVWTRAATAARAAAIR